MRVGDKQSDPLEATPFFSLGISSGTTASPVGIGKLIRASGSQTGSGLELRREVEVLVRRELERIREEDRAADDASMANVDELPPSYASAD